MVAISPYGPKIKGTAVHELQHYTTKGDELIPRNVHDFITSIKPKPDPKFKEDFLLYPNTQNFREETKALVQKWKKENTKLRGGHRAKKLPDFYLEMEARYLGSHTEIQARLQELRLALNVRPGEKVTGKMLDKIKGMKDAQKPYYELNLVISEDNIVKALNALPAMVPMMVEEELFNQWDREDNIF